MAEAQIQKALSKTEKAAIMLLCMDEKSTSALFSQLSDDEIRKVGGALLKLQHIPTSQISGVMDEFSKHVNQALGGGGENAELEVDGKKMVEKIVQKTMPRSRGSNILSSIRNLGGSFAPATLKDEKDFGKLVADYSAEILFDLLKEEHPQVIAIILSYAKKKTAKAVLEKLDELLQTDVVTRMAKLEQVSGQALGDLRGFIASQLAEKQKSLMEGGEDKEAAQSFEGLMKAITVLKAVPRAQADKIIQEIEKTDPELAQKINKQMFTIEDLERAEDAGIRELLRAIKTDELKVAIKNAPDAVKQKFFKNMSERAAGILKEDMEVMAPVKVEEVEAAQESILSAAKKLMQEEKLKLVEPEEEGN